MAITLGSNIASLKAQRSLAKSSDSLQGIFERLSSGQRINRASDDAAGLAIADSLRADARTYGASIRNINDGISMLSIMDSALEAQSGILTRLRELAAQSANGVYGDAQRDALNNEYQSLVKEFGRIGDSTEFNGKKLLDGGSETISLQVGIDSGSNSQVSFETEDTGSFSGVYSPGGDYDGDGDVDTGDSVTSNGAFALPFSDFTDLIGNNYATYQVSDSSGNVRTVYGMNRLAGFGGANQPPSDDPGSGANFFTVDDQGVIQVVGGTVFLLDGLTSTISLSFTDTSTSGSLYFDISALEVKPLAKYGPDQESAIDFTGVETTARATRALDVLENRAQELSALRGKIGATQSRLEVALRTSRSLQENYLTAESRIRDADIAFEAAELTRQTILQQAASAVLAQANQQPALVLQLLGGRR